MCENSTVAMSTRPDSSHRTDFAGIDERSDCLPFGTFRESTWP